MYDYINQVHQDDVLNFLSKLPDKSIDLVITSPPYNKKRKYGGKLVNKVEYDTYHDTMDEYEYQIWQLVVLNELYRVLKDDGHVFYNHKVRYEDGVMIHPVEWLKKSMFNVWQEIIWDRILTGNIRGWRFWNVDERIYWLVKNKNNQELDSRFAKFGSIWRIPVEKEHKIHPAVFPLEIPVRIILSVIGMNKNSVILDPFCGTGTTLLASKLTGNNYIGVDISHKYVEYSKQRLDKYLEEKQVLDKIISNYSVIL